MGARLEVTEVITLPGNLEAISAWLVKNGIALTRRNWCEVKFGFDKSHDEIDALIAGFAYAELLAEIPRYLSKARVIMIRRLG